MNKIFQNTIKVAIVVFLSIGSCFSVVAEENAGTNPVDENTEVVNEDNTEVSSDENTEEQPVEEQEVVVDDTPNESADTTVEPSVEEAPQSDNGEDSESSESGNFTSSIGFTDFNTSIFTVNNDESLEEKDSVVSDDAMKELDDALTKMKNYHLIDFSTASAILKNADGFRLSGGLQSDGLLTANPYFTAVGLEDSEEKIDDDLSDNPDTTKAVYVLDDGSNSLKASSYIYVVDKDSICIVVTDEDGNGIGNALVTISYEKDGTQITRSMRTTDGNAKGIAAFDDMDSFNFCLLDIAADGYQSNTILKETISAGEKRMFSLKKREENSVYIRGLDLNGKDMIHSDTELLLVSENCETTQIPFSILVTATGNKSLPEKVELYSETRKKVIATFTNSTKYEVGNENTAQFVLTTKWMNQNISPLQEDDNLTLKYGGNTYKIANTKIKNAVCDPGAASGVDMPIFNSISDYSPSDFNKKGGDTSTFADILQQSGMLNGSFKLGSVNITIGFFPDGGFYVLTTYDIKKLSNEWGDIFKDTWDPSQRNDFCTVMQKFQQNFWNDVAESIRDKDGLNPDITENNGVVRALSSSYGGYKSTASLFIGGKYNTKTGLWEGTVAGAFSIKWSGGRYTYYLVPVGPVVIPAFAGLEGGITGRGTIEVQMAWKDRLEFNDVQLTPQGLAALRIDIMPYAMAYFGLGIKGIVSGQLNLSATLDTGFKLEPFCDADQSVFRAFLNLLFKMEVKAHFLLFSTGFTIASSNWMRILGDVEPPYITSNGDTTQAQLYRVDLDSASEKADKVSEQTENNDGSIVLASYSEKTELMSSSNLNLSGNSDISLIASDVYADGQIQMVSTRNNTALFRIISDEGKTKLAYHKVDDEGNMSTTFNIVTVPGNSHVLEYSVVQNKTNLDDPEYQDCVYIAMVCTSADATTIEDQLKTSFMAGAIVDLKTNTQIKQVAMNTPSGEMWYMFNPMVAGNGDQVTAAFKRSTVTVNDDGTYNLNQDKALNIMYSLHYGLHTESPMGGRGELFSNGAWYSDKDPVFWQTTTYTQSEKVVVMGMSVDGSLKDDNGNLFRITVNKPEGYTFSEGEHYISHWEMMNNMVYIISCGRLYYMDNRAGTYEFTDMSGTTEFTNTGSTYQFFASGDQNILYIGAMKPNVDVFTGLNQGAKLLVYSIYNTATTTGRYFANLHGPIEMEFPDVVPNHFTISYVAKYAGTANDKGFALAFQMDDEPELIDTTTVKETTDLYYWNQASNKGFVVEEVTIKNNAVSKEDVAVNATVTFRNIGYRVAGPVRFLVQSAYTDEHGMKQLETLQQVEYDINTGKWNNVESYQGHYYKDLFAGDSMKATISFKPSKNWKPNTEYEIIVTIDPDYNYKIDPTCPVYKKEYAYGAYDGYRLTASASTPVNEIKLLTSGKLSVVNGEHYLELTIENESYHVAADPKFELVPYYDDNWTNTNTSNGTATLQTVAMGARDGLLDTNEEQGMMVGQAYNKSILVESLLKDGALQGLMSFDVYVLDENGERMSGTRLHFDNPYYEYVEEEPTKPSKGETEDTPSTPSNKPSDNPTDEEEDPIVINNDPVVIVESDLDISFSDEEKMLEIVLTEDDKKALEKGDRVVVKLKVSHQSITEEAVEVISDFLKQNGLFKDDDELTAQLIHFDFAKTVDDQTTSLNQLKKAVALTIKQKLAEGETILLMIKNGDEYHLVSDLSANPDVIEFLLDNFDQEYVLVSVKEGAKAPVTIDTDDSCYMHLIMIASAVALLVAALILALGLHKLNAVAIAIIGIASLAAAVLCNKYGSCGMDLGASIASDGVLWTSLAVLAKIQNKK